mgnify:CR=1 FL=1
MARRAELPLVFSQGFNPRPKIASRCAVFAKTDLVHAQQEGHGNNIAGHFAADGHGSPGSVAQLELDNSALDGRVHSGNVRLDDEPADQGSTGSSPRAISIGRNTELRILRCGRPKLTLLAPQMV